jgi:hypothetical protein
LLLSGAGTEPGVDGNRIHRSSAAALWMQEHDFNFEAAMFSKFNIFHSGKYFLLNRYFFTKNRPQRYCL